MAVDAVIMRRDGHYPHPALPEVSGVTLVVASVITVAALAGGLIAVGLIIRTLGRAIWGS